MTFSPFLSSLGTLALATAGGYVAHLLRLPLAWMIGAMVATAALAWRHHAAVPSFRGRPGCWCWGWRSARPSRRR